jgi:hypothetical protein
VKGEKQRSPDGAQRNPRWAKPRIPRIPLALHTEYILRTTRRSLLTVHYSLFGYNPIIKREKP